MELPVNIKILKEGVSVPARATAGSAAADLCYAGDDPVTIAPGECVALPTGIAISPGRDDVVAIVAARSGLSTKFGITLANGIGVIDSDYRGEIRVSLLNRSANAYTVNPGDRIAQLMFMPVYAPVFKVVEELDETVRQAGGFGSTGR